MTRDADPAFEALQAAVHREHEERQQELLARLQARAPRAEQGWFELGVVQLETALAWTGPALLPAARDSFERALARQSGDPKLHAFLGRCLDAQDRPAEALAAYARAAALAPEDAACQAAVATVAAEHLPEAEAAPIVHACAAALGLALPGGRMPLADQVRNTFVHARNHLGSRLRQERDRLEKRWLGRSVDQLMALELADARKALKAAVVRTRVPAALRGLVPWARRLGVGDDGLRAMAVAELTPAEQAQLQADVDPQAQALAAWTGSFGDSLPDEAAAFLYLQLAAEEARLMPASPPR